MAAEDPATSEYFGGAVLVCGRGSLVGGCLRLLPDFATGLSNSCLRVGVSQSPEGELGVEVEVEEPDPLLGI